MFDKVKSLPPLQLPWFHLQNRAFRILNGFLKCETITHPERRELLIKYMHNALYMSSLKDLTNFWQTDSTDGGASAFPEQALRASCAGSLLGAAGGAVGSRLGGSNVPTGLHAERSTHVPVNQGLQHKLLVCGLSVAHRYVFPP